MITNPTILQYQVDTHMADRCEEASRARDATPHGSWSWTWAFRFPAPRLLRLAFARRRPTASSSPSHTDPAF